MWSPPSGGVNDWESELRGIGLSWRWLAMLVGGGTVAVVAVFMFLPVWLDGASSAGADPNDVEQVTLGEAVYASECAACHGAELEGEPDWRRPLPTGGLPAPPHDPSGHTWHHPDGLLFRYTKYGGQAVVGQGFRSNMPGFEETLSDREIWAVLAFIKSRWPDDIQAQQAAINEAAR